jgi:putative peptidoglycan lipid II flippase
VQSDAIELGMLLTVPAAVALAICATPFVTMIFQGGRFDLADAATTGSVLAMLVMGLPAYVLVKVLVPNFYARADTRTPVYAAFISLFVFVTLCIWNNGLTVGGPVGLRGMTVTLPSLTFEGLGFGVAGIAAASVVGAWINVGFLYLVMLARDHYRAPIRLLGRIARQIVAAAAMGAALWFARDLLTGYYAAGIFERLFALAVLIACSASVYFGVAFAIGAVDRERLLQLTRKKAAE